MTDRELNAFASAALDAEKRRKAEAEALADWPGIVTFSTSKNSDAVSRSRYRNGKVSPTIATVQRWCKEQGLRFVVDADGVRCERIRD